MLHLELKKARQAAGMSMDEVAEKIGVSQSTLSRIEAGVAGVSSQRLIDMASAYGLSPSSLLDGSAVRTMSDTDLDRIGQVIEFVEEVLADELPRPDPKQIRDTVIAIFKQETLASWEGQGTFNPRRFEDLVSADIRKQ